MSDSKSSGKINFVHTPIMLETLLKTKLCEFKILKFNHPSICLFWLKITAKFEAKMMKKSQNHQFPFLNKSAESADFHDCCIPKRKYIYFCRRSKLMDILMMIPLRYWNFRCHIAKNGQFQKSKKSHFDRNFCEGQQFRSKFYMKKKRIMLLQVSWNFELNPMCGLEAMAIPNCDMFFNLTEPTPIALMGILFKG